MAYIPNECTLEQYEEQIYSGDSLHRLYIKHGNTIIGTEEEDYASPYSSSLTLKRRILKNGSKSFSLNNFISQEIELVLHNYQITNLSDEIEIKIGTYIKSVEKWVYVPLGIYLIQDSPTTDKDKTTYKLRDKSIKFDFNYNAEPIIESSEHVDDNNNKYVTKLEIVEDICYKAGVTYNGSKTFIGYNDPIGIYDNTVTGRAYIADIAEQASCIATIDRTGNLTFIDMSGLTERTVSEDIIEKFEIGDNYKISKVIYESGTIYFEKGTSDNDTLFINSANPYIANQEQLDRIYDNIVGFETNSLTTGKVLGNPTIDPWDLIVFTYENKTYKTLAQYTLKFNGVLISTYETKIEYEAKQTNTTKNNEATYRKYVKQEIDNVNGTLKTTVARVETVEIETDQNTTTINNNYQEIKEKFNGYTPVSKTIEIENSVTQLQTDTYTKTEINTKLTDGSVTKVQTTSGTFDEDGMHYAKTGARTSSTINQSGVSVNDTQSNDELLFAGYDEELKESIVRTENLTVRKYFVCGQHSRMEDYIDEDGNEGTGVFIL